MPAAEWGRSASSPPCITLTFLHPSSMPGIDRTSFPWALQISTLIRSHLLSIPLMATIPALQQSRQRRGQDKPEQTLPGEEGAQL